VTADLLNDLSDGARVYLVPVGFVFGGPQGRPIGNSGIKFLSVRAIVRDGNDVVFDKQVDASLGLGELMKAMPASLREAAEQQLQNIAKPRQPIKLDDNKQLVFARPIIMGVLNVTPDSFSDGGDYLDHQAAIARARAMVAEGAHIIDIGGESTRPGAKPVWEGEEAERVIPVIKALANDGIPISIDSRHSVVMEKAVAAGAHIINDVTALSYDPESINVAATAGKPVILMHSKGQPETMQDDPYYNHVLLDIYDYLEERVKACELVGLTRDRLVVDPGIGFGKRVLKDNMTLINNIGLFHSLGCPLMLGASRKRFIEAVTGETEASKRGPGSMTAAIIAMQQGCHIYRVHDVAETAQALKMMQGFIDSGIMDMRE
jgi:dihydropteroate synthase